MEATSGTTSIRVLPGELWIAIGLLAAAGGLIAWPALPVVPDAISSLSGAGEFLPFSVLFLSLVLGMLVMSVGCFWLALSLYQVDPIARSLAVALSLSLALALILQPGSGSTEIWLLLSCLGLSALLLSPRVNRHFAEETVHLGEPILVQCARALLLVNCTVLGFYGIVFLPVASLDASFGAYGAALIALSVLTYRLAARLRGGDAVARLAISVVMVGFGVVILLAGRRHPALLVPLGFSLSIIALLWGPRSSRHHFTPPGTPVPEPVARWNAFMDRVQEFLTRTTSSMTLQSPGGANLSARQSLEQRLPAFAPASPAVRGGGLRTQVLSTSPRGTGALIFADELDLSIDPRSWFPQTGDEPVIGRWRTSVAAPLDGFEGESTLVLGRSRLIGVCALGECSSGPLEPDAGRVLAWSVSLSTIVDAAMEMSEDADHRAIIVLEGESQPRLVFSGARLWRDDAFQPSDPARLASAIDSAVAQREDHC